MTFFTIGHSTRTAEELLSLLRDVGVAELVDVRTIPRSRRNPQFNEHVLSRTLEEQGIGYRHSPGLGGLRKRDPGVSVELNGLWSNRSFHNYADHALTTTFADALQELLTRERHGHCAIMCAEAVWWRCHRRIIADHLIHEGAQVWHILGPGKVHPATLTPGAVTDAQGRLVYPLPHDPSSRGLPL